MDISLNCFANKSTNLHKNIIKVNGFSVNFKTIDQKHKSLGSYITIILEDGKFILH